MGTHTLLPPDSQASPTSSLNCTTSPSSVEGVRLGLRHDAGHVGNPHSSIEGRCTNRCPQNNHSCRLLSLLHHSRCLCSNSSCPWLSRLVLPSFRTRCLRHDAGGRRSAPDAIPVGAREMEQNLRSRGFAKRFPSLSRSLRRLPLAQAYPIPDSSWHIHDSR